MADHFDIRDSEGFFLQTGGHQWKDTKGPDSACRRCGLPYSQWRGDRCDQAPDCPAESATGLRCGREAGHPYKHVAVVEWTAEAVEECS